MTRPEYERFDLTERADNGLRRGRTTGSCAAAAVKAALIKLLRGEACSQVDVVLPDQKRVLTVPIENVATLDDGSARAEVVKYAGDDPDNTDGATIFAVVRANGTGSSRFIAGEGVGVVTEPGIRVSVGEPAINPGPRAMINFAVLEVLDGEPNPGFDLEIGCVDGEQIARRTFNGRLGIKGGISILGTTGIVEPMSLSAYMAAIEVYIRVALTGNQTSLALLPGNIGTVYAREQLRLPKKRVVFISNFLGFSVDFIREVLAEEKRTIESLWILGHPGKIAKVLDGYWDTHSQRSRMAMPTIARVAADFQFSALDCRRIASANTVEAVVELLAADPRGTLVWRAVEERASKVISSRLRLAGAVCVRLFGMTGKPLGEA